jgi:hypothetical protein
MAFGEDQYGILDSLIALRSCEECLLLWEVHYRPERYEFMLEVRQYKDDL